MTFTAFLRKKLVDLLGECRIVVWYDGEGDFPQFAASFEAPHCEVLSAQASVLKARRRADEIYRQMNESDDAVESGRCMLIYMGAGRGRTDEERARDPFEVYALAGTAFGDTEDERIVSLARQAMPERADEIDRLFREGRPSVSLLDSLLKAQAWPILCEVLGTETPADVIAIALCDPEKMKEIDSAAGALEELVRLLEASVGFRAGARERKWKSLRGRAAEYVLFSEFVFDLPGPEPEALNEVRRADAEYRRTILSACDRMRSDGNLRNQYADLARKVEADLRLDALVPADVDLGQRDTFPFEERRSLERVVTYVLSGDHASAHTRIGERARSLWRSDPQRSPRWTVVERADQLLVSTAKTTSELGTAKGLRSLIEGYTGAGWAETDRTYRLFEAALTACADDPSLSPLADECRSRYRDAIAAGQSMFLKAIGDEGWPPEGVRRQTQIFDEFVRPALDRRERVALFLVDSLRFEMGCDLGEALEEWGEANVAYAAASLPTVTAVGMAALMPGADGGLKLQLKDGKLVPSLGTKLLKGSVERMKLLSDTYGDRFTETTLDNLLGSQKKLAPRLKGVQLLVVRTQDPDQIAETFGGWRARKWLSDVIGEIAGAVRSAVAMGFTRVVVCSDHGHMHFPEILPGDVVQGPPGAWLEDKRRCLLGAGLAGSAGTVTFKASRLGIQGDVDEVCFPSGYGVFEAGEGYFHGGLSLQEAVVPVVSFKASIEQPLAPGKPEIEIRYRSDRFTGRVIGVTIVLRQAEFFLQQARVRVEAYDGSGAKARLVGEAADCPARDEKTHEVSLSPDRETSVPVLLDQDFEGQDVEIRVSDPQTRIVWARRKLKNAMLD